MARWWRQGAPVTRFCLASFAIGSLNSREFAHVLVGKPVPDPDQSPGQAFFPDMR
jgi:hypothetical protein